MIIDLYKALGFCADHLYLTTQIKREKKAEHCIIVQLHISPCASLIPSPRDIVSEAAELDDF